ncbi:MAG: hypothetical protein Q9226_003482 [Calogaya cf. arnoldii]
MVPTLTKIPLEIRLQIYKYLLTIPAAITKPGSLVKRPIYIGVDKRRATGLDARILRVSRQIYIEALPILYSENVFAFRNSDCLKEFQSKGLAPAYTTYLGRITRNPIFIDSTYFGLKNNPDGRLTIIRHVEIHFKEGENNHILESENSHMMLDWRRDSIVRKWRAFFHPYSSRHDVRLPALSDLTLDFTGMDLGSTEGFVIKPIVEKFRTLKGLRRLKVVGLRERECLDALKEALVGEKGGFEVV